MLAAADIGMVGGSIPTILDPFDEVNYLGLECEFLGAGWIRPQPLSIVDEMLGGAPPPELMTLYGAFRATLRARICLAHLDDDVPMEPERRPDETRAYLRLAEEYLARRWPMQLREARSPT